MDILSRWRAGGETPDPAKLLAAIPYCQLLGLTAEVRDGALVLIMPFGAHLIGNPVLPAIHGGVIGSLMETAALAQIVWEGGVERLPKPVDINIDYLRTGRPVTSYASARITKQGRRVVNVHAQMWQEDAAKPVAALRAHFLIAGS
ncbi:MAG: PaaI family thioesterase [Alphaproteobacteria bacterium]|nr:PaaI family thioesterase [Alphaproteobacteria bacterium]